MTILLIFINDSVIISVKCIENETYKLLVLKVTHYCTNLINSTISNKQNLRNILLQQSFKTFSYTTKFLKTRQIRKTNKNGYDNFNFCKL